VLASKQTPKLVFYVVHKFGTLSNKGEPGSVVIIDLMLRGIEIEPTTKGLLEMARDSGLFLDGWF